MGIWVEGAGWRERLGIVICGGSLDPAVPATPSL